MRKFSLMCSAFVLCVASNVVAGQPGVAQVSDQSSAGVIVPVHGVHQPKAIGPLSYQSCPTGHLHGAHRAPSPTYVWMSNDGSVTYPPTYGWAKPVKYPMRRIPIVYDRMYGKYLYGTKAPANEMWNPVFPQVYQPTDTTQLGYRYQHVPVWQPRPGFVPGRPHPSHWHYRKAVHGHYGGYHGHPCPHGHGGAIPVESGKEPTPIDDGKKAAPSKPADV